MCGPSAVGWVSRKMSRFIAVFKFVMNKEHQNEGAEKGLQFGRGQTAVCCVDCYLEYCQKRNNNRFNNLDFRVLYK